ncbi:MAG: hypothetical protein IKN64_11970 [Desulfovibrio sp.]|nr:hypothetical protein [Desulfovibrio sp.]
MPIQRERNIVYGNGANSGKTGGKMCLASARWFLQEKEEKRSFVERTSPADEYIGEEKYFINQRIMY